MRILVVVALLTAGCARVHADVRPAPKQGEACDANGRCAPGLTCLHYRGIAGARGPELSSCEIPCAHGERCPAGQACATLADGPGPVCRPTVKR